MSPHLRRRILRHHLQNRCERRFYGSTTVGEKGQVVVPAEAREALKLEKGDKLLAFGMGDMLVFAKSSHLEKFAERLSTKLDSIRGILSKAEKSNG